MILVGRLSTHGNCLACQQKLALVAIRGQALGLITYSEEEMERRREHARTMPRVNGRFIPRTPLR